LRENNRNASPLGARIGHDGASPPSLEDRSGQGSSYTSCAKRKKDTQQQNATQMRLLSWSGRGPWKQASSSRPPHRFWDSPITFGLAPSWWVPLLRTSPLTHSLSLPPLLFITNSFHTSSALLFFWAPLIRVFLVLSNSFPSDLRKCVL